MIKRPTAFDAAWFLMVTEVVPDFYSFFLLTLGPHSDAGETKKTRYI
jgi:hypothetical protein